MNERACCPVAAPAAEGGEERNRRADILTQKLLLVSHWTHRPAHQTHPRVTADKWRDSHTLCNCSGSGVSGGVIALVLEQHQHLHIAVVVVYY